MPFTPSHVAAVLPFLRTPLPVAGLVIGGMVPDLPYFVPLGVSRDLTHSLPGVVIADLPMGLVVLALWALVFQAPLRDFAPGWLRLRLPPVREYRADRVASTILLVVLAIIAGVVTHLAWDSFTHPDGWLVLAVPAFQAQLGPFALYRWAQYASSVVGIVVVFVWLILWMRRTPAPREELPEHRLSTRARRIAWAAVAVPGVIVGTVIWVHGLMGGTDAFDRVLVFRTATLSISCAGLIAVVLTLAWYLLPRRQAPIKREQD